MKYYISLHRYLEVNQVYKDFLASGASKAARMPYPAWDLVRNHCTVHQPATLIALLITLFIILFYFVIFLTSIHTLPTM